MRFGLRHQPLDRLHLIGEHRGEPLPLLKPRARSARRSSCASAVEHRCVAALGGLARERDAAVLQHAGDGEKAVGASASRSPPPPRAAAPRRRRAPAPSSFSDELLALAFRFARQREEAASARDPFADLRAHLGFEMIEPGRKPQPDLQAARVDALQLPAKTSRRRPRRTSARSRSCSIAPSFPGDLRPDTRWQRTPARLAAAGDRPSSVGVRPPAPRQAAGARARRSPDGAALSAASPAARRRAPALLICRQRATLRLCSSSVAEKACPPVPSATK